MLVVQKVMVAKADGGREDDGDVGENGAEPVGVRLLEHDVVRVFVDQYEERVIGEGAERVGGDDDPPPGHVKQGQADADGDLQRDENHCPNRRRSIALEKPAHLRMPSKNLLRSLAVRRRRIGFSKCRVRPCHRRRSFRLIRMHGRGRPLHHAATGKRDSNVDRVTATVRPSAADVSVI